LGQPAVRIFIGWKRRDFTAEILGLSQASRLFLPYNMILHCAETKVTYTVEST